MAGQDWDQDLRKAVPGESYNFVNIPKRGIHMGCHNFGFGLVAVTMLLVLSAPVPLIAQSDSLQRPEPQIGQSGEQGESVPKEMADKMAKDRLKSRYENLKRDSEKLLELATELKQYVDKSGQNTMSLEVIRKCDEIEKLSKSVRAKMKGD